MAKSSPSLADLSRMRREARKAKESDSGGSSHEPSLQETVAEVSSVALPPKDTASHKDTPSDKAQNQQETSPQSSKTETAQKPKPTSALDLEEAKPAETEEQTSSIQSDRRSETSNNSKSKIVPEQKPSEVEEQKKVGRPKGIRSNPDYESTTIRLHKQVKAKARYILSTQPEKMDLQTLLNNLLEDFVQEQDV